HLDGKGYLPLKKGVNGLYIHSASKSAKVHFENIGRFSSLHEALHEVTKDYDDACYMQEHFQEIRETLGNSERKALGVY
ncbi:MAG: hypothetical protein ACOC4M_11805, partial [Promethearchaeia archaeon]